MAAHASNSYYIVVPVKGAKGLENLQVSLAPQQLPQAMVGTPYAGVDFNSLLTVKGDAAYSGYGVSWRIIEGTLPAGLTLSTSGKLTGTPTTPGAATIRVQATYKTKTGEQAYEIVSVGIDVSLAQASLPQAKVGKPYAYALASLLSVKGDKTYAGSGVTWTVVSNTLPAGLYLADTGSIVGTPTAPGSGAITVRATYRGVNGEQTYQVFTMDITVALAADTPTQAVLGQAYSYDLKKLLVVTGDDAYAESGVTWSVVSSSLPAGLSLKTDGTIAGTPTAAGTGTLTARATYRGVNGEQTYQVVSLDIKVTFAPALMPQARVGNYYYVDLRNNISVSGDDAYNYTKLKWAVVSGAFPAGLSLGDTGYVDGTPTKSETKSVTLRATYRGVSAEQTIEVAARSLEDDVPNALDTGTGDGNGDGMRDSDQANVHSLLTVVTGTPYATLAVPTGYTLTNVVAKAGASGLPRAYKQPVGQFNFNVNNVPPGGTVEVSLYVPSNYGLTGYYSKDAAGYWISRETSVTVVGSKTKVTFSATDGGPFDRDGVVNGVISE